MNCVEYKFGHPFSFPEMSGFDELVGNALSDGGLRRGSKGFGRRMVKCCGLLTSSNVRGPLELGVGKAVALRLT